jgi:hypothetical protein
LIFSFYQSHSCCVVISLWLQLTFCVLAMGGIFSTEL